jgi:signal transduction histidine kinase
LSKDRESLTLYVEDDGVGFPEASRLRRGFGLSGMRERMTQVGGVLDLQSAPGLGTRVIARVPASAVFQKQGNTP